MNQHGWSDQAIADLRSLWAEGLSASQIAAQLNRTLKTRFSRNAIIGKVHRLGIAERENGIKRTPPPASPTHRRAARTRIMAAAAAKHERLAAPKDPGRGLGIPLAALEFGQCRAVTGDNGTEALFCGHPQRPGSSYCADHHRLYHQPASAEIQRERKRKAMRSYFAERAP